MKTVLICVFASCHDQGVQYVPDQYGQDPPCALAVKVRLEPNKLNIVLNTVHGNQTKVSFGKDKVTRQSWNCKNIKE